MTSIDELLDVCRDMAYILEWWQHPKRQSDYSAVMLALRRTAPRFIEAVKAVGDCKPLPPDISITLTYQGRETTTTVAGLKAALAGLKK